MSRFHYWQYLLNTEGQPIPDANISLYLAGTDATATIYFDEFGSNHSDQAPQIITNNLGYFEFWVGDDSEEFGYEKGQKFKLEWEKPGVALGSIDWIDIFPHVVEVDITDSFSDSKNKVISNKMAFRWEEHKNHTLQNDGFPIHGIEAVNETDTNKFPNKTISNFIANKWDSHVNYSFSSLPTSASGYPHDIRPVIETDSNNTFNRLVSNKLILDINEGISNNQNDIVTIYDMISEMGNAGNIFVSHELNNTWTLTHNFGVKYVSVTAYGTDDKEVRPADIELIDYNSVKLLFDEPVEGYAVITGKVVANGPDIPPFEIIGDHGSLTGLNSDDHIIYILSDGSRPFSNPISGVYPTLIDHLTTKEYVDYEINNIVLSHSKISKSSIGDDHNQYIHIDGRRGFTNPISGMSPIYSNHLATKHYVDNIQISHLSLLDNDHDSHTRYLHVDGRRGFSGTVTGVYPIESNHLTTKEYVDNTIQSVLSTEPGNTSNIYIHHVLSNTWILTHNFGVKYVSVTAYGTDDKEIKPADIELIDYNSIKLLFDDPVEGYAVITGRPVEGGLSQPPFEIIGDHGSLTGLLSDDHTIYTLVDGSRGFSNPISGIYPINDNHLATKKYVDDEIDNAININVVIDHNDLLGLDNDDHIQYILTDGSRSFSGPVEGINPVNSNHLTTKEYVDHINRKNEHTITSFNGTGPYTKIINHGLDDPFPFIIIWNTSNKKVVYPLDIISLDNNRIEITMSTNEQLLVKVKV